MTDAEIIKELSGSLRLMLRFIADHSLRIETCRLVMRAHGVTAEEFAEAHATLTRRWEAQGDVLVEPITESMTAEQLRRLLELPEG
jgi:hypothetical protein